MKTVILLSGKAEAGKTTAANILKNIMEKDSGLRIITPSFGNYVKFIASKYYGWDGKKDENGRSLLQKIGTDSVRRKRPDFWVESVINLLDALDYDFDVAIIDDVRFENEISSFYSKTDYSVFSMRITRGEHENSLTPEQRKHESEVALDNYSLFDLYIENNAGVS